jgi:hypothetical protein
MTEAEIVEYLRGSMGNVPSSELENVWVELESGYVRVSATPTRGDTLWHLRGPDGKIVTPTVPLSAGYGTTPEPIEPS